jgi:DNA polymerase III epsilon subunit family exonuclease
MIMGLLSWLFGRKNPNQDAFEVRKGRFSQALPGGRAAEDQVHLELRKERKKEKGSRIREKRVLAALHASLGTFVVADCETSGLSARGNRVIELSAVRYDIEGMEVERFSSLVKFRGKLNTKIVSLTGITDEALRSQGRPAKDVVAEFFEFVSQAPVFFHNAPFDLGFLEAEGERVFGRGEAPYLDAHCTLEMARHLRPDLKNHKLQTVAEAAGSRVKPSHRGLSDVAATKDVVLFFRKKCLGV